VTDRVPYPLEIAFELTALGARIRAERHRREHPGASDAEMEAVVGAWLQARPGAPFGDSEGRPVPFPRS
jgi:hypothetical protein